MLFFGLSPLDGRDLCDVVRLLAPEGVRQDRLKDV